MSQFESLGYSNTFVVHSNYVLLDGSEVKKLAHLVTKICSP